LDLIRIKASQPLCRCALRIPRIKKGLAEATHLIRLSRGDAAPHSLVETLVL